MVLSSPERPATAASRVSTTEVRRTLTSWPELHVLTTLIENADDNVDLNSATKLTETVTEAAKIVG